VPGEQSREILEEALAALGDGYDSLRAKLLAYLAGTPPYHGSVEKRSELSARALELARGAGDPDALCGALAARAFALMGVDHIEERLCLADELLEISEQRGGGTWTLPALETRVRSFLPLGDLASADRDNARYRELAERLHLPAFQFLAEPYAAARALADGRFDDVEAHCHRQVELGSASQHPAAKGFIPWYRMWLERERGVPVLQDLAEQVELPALSGLLTPTFEAVLKAVFTLINAEKGYASETQRVLDQFPEQALLALPHDEHWITTMALLAAATAQLAETTAELADATVQAQNQKRAATFYDLLLPYAELNVADDLLRTYFGSTHYYLARLATCLERLDQAEIHFEAALRFNRGLGAVPLVARTQAAWGQLLLSRGRAEDRLRARDLIEQAHSTALLLGMPDLARQTEDTE
jgi:hypothetical protein